MANLTIKQLDKLSRTQLTDKELTVLRMSVKTTDRDIADLLNTTKQAVGIIKLRALEKLVAQGFIDEEGHIITP